MFIVNRLRDLCHLALLLVPNAFNSKSRTDDCNLIYSSGYHILALGMRLYIYARRCLLVHFIKNGKSRTKNLGIPNNYRNYNTECEFIMGLI